MPPWQRHGPKLHPLYSPGSPSQRNRHVINSGCFRGWLIAQGREVFDVLSIAWDAHIRATGEQLPVDA